MKSTDHLVVALDDSIPSTSYINDYSLWNRPQEMTSDIAIPAGYSVAATTTRTFGSRNYGTDLRSSEDTPALTNQWENVALETYPVKNEYNESVAALSYFNSFSNLAAASLGENVVPTDQAADAFVKPDAGVGAYTSQLAYNTNEAISSGYFGTHAVAASFVDSASIDSIGAGAWGRQMFPSEVGLMHRHSLPDVGSARMAYPDKDYNNQTSFGLYDVAQFGDSSLLGQAVATPNPSILPGNYTINQRRSVSENLDKSPVQGHGGPTNSWKSNMDFRMEPINRDCSIDTRGEGDHPYDTIPMACMSAQERWGLYIKNNEAIQEPQESMICTHCEVKFDVLEKYLEHLDMEKVKHENFCPDHSCSFSAIGFRFRWLLRRHICNHHLKTYNNDSAKKHPVKVPDKLLKEFLRHVYVCNELKCLRAFYRLDSLLRHMRLIHGLLKRVFRKDRSGKWIIDHTGGGDDFQRQK